MKKNSNQTKNTNTLNDKEKDINLNEDSSNIELEDIDNNEENTETVIEENNEKKTKKNTSEETTDKKEEININEIINKFNEVTERYNKEIEKIKKENIEKLESQKKFYENEIENVKTYGLQKFFNEIFVVLDSLELGLQNKNRDNIDKFIEGFKMTQAMCINIFNKYGLSIIEVKINDDFNDNFHECLGTDNNVDNNKIASIISTGYTYNGRVIRPTRVIVGTK